MFVNRAARSAGPISSRHGESAIEEVVSLPEYRATAGRLSIDVDRCRTHLRVGPGRVLDLTSDPGGVSAVAPIWRRTGSVDTFKSWIGTEDEACPPGSIGALYWPVPSASWSGRPFETARDLTTAELADIEAAGRAYIFGNSAPVASYRPAIERATGVFEAAVYAARHVSIAEGGTLRVSGAPAVLLFASLDIAPGGQLIVTAPCRAAIGRLRKGGAEASPDTLAGE